MAYKLSIALVASMTAYSTYVILAIVAWPLLFIIVPMVSLTIRLQVLPVTLEMSSFSGFVYVSCLLNEIWQLVFF